MRCAARNERNRHRHAPAARFAHAAVAVGRAHRQFRRYCSRACSEPCSGAIAGYLVLWCVYWVFRLVRGVEGMGYGDFKLLAALGAWLGWAALPQIVLIAAVTGAVVGLIATWIGRMRFEEPLPFGPFLAPAAR